MLNMNANPAALRKSFLGLALTAVGLLVVLLPARSQAQVFAANGACAKGGIFPSVSGQPGTNPFLASYPQCQVTVYLTGTSTLASLFANNLSTPTPLSNPFTANLDGSWLFFAAAGQYDINLAGGTPFVLPVPVTLTAVSVGGGGGGGGGGIGTQFQTAYYNPANVLLGYGPGLAGQVAMSQGPSLPPQMTSTGILDGPASPVATTPYLVQCDSGAATLDRTRVIRFQAGAGVVTVPLSSSAGCGGGFTVRLLDDGAGTLTVNRSSPDTFSVFNGASAADGAASFTLANGGYATLNQGAAGLWEVAVSAAGGGGTVTGSGTAGTIPLWSGSTALGNSALTDNGTVVKTTEPFVVHNIISGLDSEGTSNPVLKVPVLMDQTAQCVSTGNSLSTTPLTLCTMNLPNLSVGWAFSCFGIYTIGSTSTSLVLSMNQQQAGSESALSTISSVSADGSSVQSAISKFTSSGSTGNVVIQTGPAVSSITSAPWSIKGQVTGSSSSGTFQIAAALSLASAGSSIGINACYFW